MRKRALKGGLFPEDRRRRHPVALEPSGDETAESVLRSRIHTLLLRSNFQAAVTDAKTVEAKGGPRQLVYPEGWPDITASIPVTGRAWAIEVKKRGEDLRPSQAVMLAALEAAGWLVTIAEGLEGVVEVGAEIKRQLAAVPRGELEAYLVRLRQVRSEDAARAALGESRKRERNL